MTNFDEGHIQSDEQPIRWLITGGCGFIGTNLITHLLKKIPHAKIRVLDNLSVGNREDLDHVCNFIELDLHILGRSSPVSDSNPLPPAPCPMPLPVELKGACIDTVAWRRLE